MIDTYNAESLRNAMTDPLESDEKGELKDTAIKLLQAADFNISDYKFTVKHGEISDFSITTGPFY